jgi:hypothetical protein
LRTCPQQRGRITLELAEPERPVFLFEVPLAGLRIPPHRAAILLS